MREQIRRFLNWRTAFAELLIVIVGVLIALSVDSWWEERSDRIEEAEHLAALRMETEQNLAELYRSFARLELLSDSTRELIKIVEGARDRLFDDHVAAVVRPDRYVFGVVDEDWDLDRLVLELGRKLALR